MVAEAATSARSGGGSSAPTRGWMAADVGRRPADGVAPTSTSTTEVSASRVKEESLLLSYSVPYSFHPLGMLDNCTKQGVPDTFSV
jgi:hypothetical protein